MRLEAVTSYVQVRFVCQTLDLAFDWSRLVSLAARPALGLVLPDCGAFDSVLECRQLHHRLFVVRIISDPVVGTASLVEDGVTTVVLSEYICQVNASVTFCISLEIFHLKLSMFDL